MCFSATASFGAGALLTTIGVATLVKSNSPSQKMFAAIPLLFATQQITEGFVWLSLSNAQFASLEVVCTYIFLFIAQVVWPIWVPYSIMKMDPRKRRRAFEYVLAFIGLCVSLYLGYCLANYPVKAAIDGHHISYIQKYPSFANKFSGVFYVIATVLPPFFSRVNRMWMLGTSILISYLITAYFYADYIVSVWCFFASVISISIYAILYIWNHPARQYAHSNSNPVTGALNHN